MEDESAKPLLDRASVGTANAVPQSADRDQWQHGSSHRSHHRRQFRLSGSSNERTPLLISYEDTEFRYGTEDRGRSASPGSLDSHQSKGRRPWPIIIAWFSLTVAALLVLVLGFIVPATVKEYAEQAAVFTPEKISLDSATSDGIRTRIQAAVVLDGSRVQSKPVRDIGRFATWIAGKVETSETEVDVHLPDYRNALLGTATIPPIMLNIRNGRVNHIDILADLHSGDLSSIRELANDWMIGRLTRLRVSGTAKTNIRSGILNFGNQIISTSVVLDEKDIPALPSTDVTKLNIHDLPERFGENAVGVNVSIEVSNDYALELTIPSLGFDIFVPNCGPNDPYILVANAETDVVNVRPAVPAVVNASGIIKSIPKELTATCPGEKDSPLDRIISSYINGLQTMIYVRGADAPSADTPPWMVDLLKSVTIPIPVTSHGIGQVIKNFTMADVHFTLPDPFADPDTPESRPKVSALVQVFINLPKQMNFEVDIPRVRAKVDVFYKGNKFGFLDLSEWQPANATRVNGTNGDDPLLMVTSRITDGPLQVTDNDVFSKVVQAYLFGNEPVALDLDALVDGEIEAALGRFTIHDIPAQGRIEVKSSFGDLFNGLEPKINTIEVTNTTKSAVSLRASVNFTNPSLYSADIPYVDILLLSNGSILAHLTAHGLSVVPGENADVTVEAVWDPLTFSGDSGVSIGRRLISDYISGLNTTVTLRSHKGSLPALPGVGEALSKIQFDVSVPQLQTPGDDNDGDGGASRFIKAATLHLWSSTAVFTLASPLPNSTLYVTDIDAVALYNHTAPVGTIVYSIPFPVPPGLSQTPRLPVELDLNGVGYDAVRKALGGTLKMDARAKIGIRLGEYETVIDYRGKGIGARITF